MRRALRAGEKEVVPRVSDLDALASSTSGKIEIETLEEGREGQIVENMLKGAVLTVFKERLTPERLREVVAAFDDGIVAHTGEDVPVRTGGRAGDQRARPARAGRDLTGGDESPAAVAAAVEFVLEGLHLSKRLNKDATGARGDLPQPNLTGTSPGG